MSKITPEEVETVVKATRFYYDGLTTIAVVECHNGFKAVGKASAVDHAHYSRVGGEKFSRIDALREVYSALAFTRLGVAALAQKARSDYLAGFDNPMPVGVAGFAWTTPSEAL